MLSAYSLGLVLSVLFCSVKCANNRQSIGYVRGSSNGKICKSTNGTVGTIFTNGNQKTLNVFLLPMVPLVLMVPLVDHMVEFLSY